MQIHPIADIFPRMSDEDFAALRADIETYGVREPAWTWNGVVIDGRHRVQACEDLGIKCPTREYEGTEAELVSFVLSLNLKRRHLDASQRSLVAASIAKLEKGANQHAQICAPSQSEAAEMLNVSRRSVQAAKKVIDEGVPELKEAVEQGKVSVSAAAKVAELPKVEQRKAVKQGTVVEKAAEAKPEKLSEVERLEAQVKELTASLAEMSSQQQGMLDELMFLQKIESEGDKLAAALKEVKRLQEVVRVLEERNRGMQAKEAHAVRAARLATEKVARLERELKKWKGK